MKAWQFVNTHEPLMLAHVDEPKAAPDGVVIDVKGVGLCHSDVALFEDEGWLKILDKLPITIGHEIAGVIAEVGQQVSGWKIGDRVGICPGTTNGAPGYTFDGGFAPKIAISRETLVHIPDDVGFLQGAAATDAGMTSHQAIFGKGQVKAGDKVGIIGFGGLGSFGTRMAALEGAEVYVAEINETVWDHARQAGATEVRSSIAEFQDVGLDVIVDFAGFGTTTAQAVETVRRGGRVVQVGLGRLEATINTHALTIREVTLIGSQSGTPEDVAKVYGYLASGRLHPPITEISFEEIPEGLERLRRGEVVGRLVARVSD